MGMSGVSSRAGDGSAKGETALWELGGIRAGCGMPAYHDFPRGSANVQPHGLVGREASVVDEGGADDGVG